MADIGTNRNSGEYPMPLVRTTNVNIPIVSGYVTGRLRTEAVSVSGYGLNTAMVVLENVGTTSFTVQMRETPHYVSGPFSNIGPAVALVPSGQKTLTITPIRDILEFRGVTGSGELRAQLSSQLRWEHMAFDKTETNYPSSLAKKFPDPSPPPANL